LAPADRNPDSRAAPRANACSLQLQRRALTWKYVVYRRIASCSRRRFLTMLLETLMKAFRFVALAASLLITAFWVFSAVTVTQVARLETITPTQIRAAAFATVDSVPVAHRG
jgi:hypothetical protein